MAALQRNARCTGLLFCQKQCTRAPDAAKIVAASSVVLTVPYSAVHCRDSGAAGLSPQLREAKKSDSVTAHRDNRFADNENGEHLHIKLTEEKIDF